MLDPDNGEAWIRAMQTEFPWTAPLAHDEPALPHLCLPGVADAFVEHAVGTSKAPRATREEWRRLLDWIEENYPYTGQDSSHVENLVAVSFIEDLPHTSEERRQISLLLPPKLRATYAELEGGWWKPGRIRR